jgi:sarcosine oxidase
MRYDAIVVGLGAAGSATLYQLARRGARVLGIDRFAPPHAFGSSTGETRITRIAVGEGEVYAPLAARSHELWRAIEAETGAELLTVTGALILGSRGSAARHHGVADFVGRTIECARRFGTPHEVLEAAAIAERFPQLGLRGDEVACLEPGAGFVRPERSIAAQLELARRHGASVATGTPVLGLDAAGNGDAVEVRTAEARLLAGQAVVTAGAWLPQLLDPVLAAPFRVYRQVQYWFDVAAVHDRFRPDRFPVFIWMFGDGEHDYFYGFPAIDGPAGGIKLATEQYALAVEPDTVDRTVGEAEARAMFARCVAGRLRGVEGRMVRAKACLYTATPDRGFVVDRHPGLPRVLVASACSGHGFKHSAALGEAIAEQVLDGGSRIDLAPFALRRFA